jgi:hypothetical protein
MCGPSSKAFGAIWLDKLERGTFTWEDVDLLSGMTEGAIPPWLIPFI